MSRRKNRLCDTHHLLWPRCNWNKGLAKLLRRHWYLKVEVPRMDLHSTIHGVVQEMPVPRAISIKNALSQLDALEKYGAIHPSDSIEKRLYILMSLFDCCEPKLYKALKRQYTVVCQYTHTSR